MIALPCHDLVKDQEGWRTVRSFESSSSRWSEDWARSSLEATPGKSRVKSRYQILARFYTLHLEAWKRRALEAWKTNQIVNSHRPSKFSQRQRKTETEKRETFLFRRRREAWSEFSTGRQNQARQEEPEHPASLHGFTIGFEQSSHVNTRSCALISLALSSVHSGHASP